MDAHERLAWPGCVEQRVAPRRHLPETAADGEHEIGVAQPRGERVVHRDAEDAHVRRRVVVHEVLAAERTRDRQVVRFAEREHALADLLRPAALADDDQRPLGGRQQFAEASQILRPGRRLCDLDRRRVLDVGLLGEHVLRQAEDDRPRTTGESKRVRACDVVRYPLRALDLPRGLRDPAEDLRVVELLPRLAASERARHLADEQEHRRRVLAGRVHSDRRLRRARAARDQADPRSSRELAVRLGGVRGTLLVPARDEPDRGVVERVEHRQEALAGEAEREVRAVQRELVDEDLTPGSQRRGSSSRIVARWSFGLSSSAGSR